MQFSEAPMYIFRKMWITPSKMTKKRVQDLTKLYFSEVLNENTPFIHLVYYFYIYNI